MKRVLLLIVFFLALTYSGAKEFDYTKYTSFKLGMSIQEVDSLCEIQHYEIEKDSSTWVISKYPKFMKLPVERVDLNFEKDSISTITFNFYKKSSCTYLIKLLAKDHKMQSCKTSAFFSTNTDIERRDLNYLLNFWKSVDGYNDYSLSISYSDY